MDKLIITLVTKLAHWVLGKKFFNAVYAAVEKFDGVLDLNGDGKKEAVLDEVVKLGYTFGKRQFNRAVELALIIVERK
jgi:hypothetical protein